MLERIKGFDKQTRIISGVTILCIIVTLLLSVNTIKYYSQKKITVHATISTMEYYDNSTADDVDCGYRIYVDYHCLGNAYKDILYKDVEENTDWQEGTKIDVEVYAKNPEKIANNTFVNFWFFLAASIGLSILSIKKIKSKAV